MAGKGPGHYSTYSLWLIKYRWLAIILSVAVLMVVGYGASNLTLSNEYRIFFSPDNPDLQAHDRIEETYSKVDNTTIFLKWPDGDVFTKDRLAFIHRLTDEAWKLEYVSRVDSITNYQMTFADGDDLIIEDLVLDPEDLSADRVARVKAAALSEAMTKGRLISEDGLTTMIMVTYHFPDEILGNRTKAANEARSMRERFQSEDPAVRIALSGIVMLSNAFEQAAIEDVTTLFPIMALILILTMVLFVRSVTGTFAALAVVIFTVIVTMGILGYLGFIINGVTVNGPIIILTIAIADSIHILTTTYAHIAKGDDRHTAIKESLRLNMQPVFITSITTAAGFMSLNFSDAPPFREMGNLCAIGAIVAWAYSIFFLPALMAVLPMKKRSEGRLEAKALGGVVGFVSKRPGMIALLTGGLSVLFLVMIPNLTINDRFVEFFDPSMEFRRDSDFISENLPGVYFADYSLGSGETLTGVADPNYLKYLENFSVWLRAQPEVSHISSMADVMKRLNRSMHGDDPAMYRLPEDPEVAAQYMLLYEMSVPQGLDLNNQLNIDKSASRIMVALHNVDSNDMQSLKFRSEAWLADNLPPEMGSKLSGVSIIFSFLTERNVRAMFKGSAAALIMISILLIFALKSLRLGLVSLLPNLTPPIFAFGVWAILVGQVGASSALVSAASLGLIVDFTVHFLAKYRRARYEKSLSAMEGVRYAFDMVGSALWISAFVLIAGFLVLSFSNFALNEQFGTMLSLIIFIALLTDFFVLPAILLLIDGRKEKLTQSVPAASE